jgi:hypothetical protein
MKNRKWLDEELGLDSDKINAVLKSYFDENQILFGLTQLELNKVSCLFASRLLNTPDCMNKEFRTLTYRQIFDILITVYDSLEPDNDDLTTECYKLTQFFYIKNSL